MVLETRRDGGSVSLEIAHHDAHCAIGVFENFLLATWKDLTLIPSVRLFAAEASKLAAQYSNTGIGLVQVLEEGIQPLGSDERAEFKRIFSAGSNYIVCSTVVYEGRGFRAAAIRGVVTGQALLMKTNYPHTVFADGAAAAEWHVAHMRPHRPTLTKDRLMSAVTKLRSLHSRADPEANQKTG